MAALMPSTNKQSLTELIRRIRKASAWFGSIRLEKEKPKGMTWLLRYWIRIFLLCLFGFMGIAREEEF
jgi:hypothetical protein